MRNIGLMVIVVLAASGLVAPQNIADSNIATRLLALEHAWNQAEERKDTKAMDSIMDNALVYVDYDGTLQTKAQFLAKIKSPNLHPQQEVTESMTAHVFASTGVVTGVYVAKGVENGKPYSRRGRFIDTWALKDGMWVCVASQATPILR
jgi:hypothetical protein